MKLVGRENKLLGFASGFELKRVKRNQGAEVEQG
jgi:hypothetical protein